MMRISNDCKEKEEESRPIMMSMSNACKEKEEESRPINDEYEQCL
jgi:hypothetical protein